MAPRSVDSSSSNPAANNSFGGSLALDGDTLVVGSVGQDTLGSNSGAAYVFTRTAGVWSQQAFLKASNPGASDNFGRSIDVDGDTLIVGAPNEDSNALGVGGSQTDNSAANSGAAYVFVRSGTSWLQQAYVKASNTGADDQFGYSVALVGDTAVVGAVNEASNATGVNGVQSNNSQSKAGATYVFTRSGSTWSQQAYLKASNTDNNDQFGIALAMSGETLVIGSAGESSSSPGVNGNQLDESQQDAGAAYVFVRTSGVWAQQAYIKASNPGLEDLFGIEVALHGDTLVVGAFHENSNATGVDGNQADESADDAGAAYVFERNGTTWSQLAYLKASNTQAGDSFGGACAVFGESIVCSAIAESSNATGIDGDQANDLAPQAGACYAFVLEPNSFTTLSGCFAINTAALTSTSPGLELGQAALLDLTAGLYPNGLALLYYGTDGTNDFGCGVVLPGFGEMLLGIVPTPVHLATTAVTVGTGQFVVNVPNNPSFIGFEIAFQAVNVDLLGSGVELSNALQGTIAP